MDDPLKLSVQDDAPIVRPGTPAFRCIADECDAMCCRNPYRVDLGEDEVARLASERDIAPLLDERASMTLLVQEADACILLEDRRCSAYGLRPNGCRLYPYRLELEDDGPPNIVRDLACPGFIGPPLSESEYALLLDELRELSAS